MCKNSFQQKSKYLSETLVVTYCLILPYLPLFFIVVGIIWYATHIGDR